MTMERYYVYWTILLLSYCNAKFNSKGNPKEGIPGEDIPVDEDGTTVVITFEKTPGETPEIGKVTTEACVHPST